MRPASARSRNRSIALAVRSEVKNVGSLGAIGIEEVQRHRFGMRAANAAPQHTLHSQALEPLRAKIDHGQVWHLFGVCLAQAPTAKAADASGHLSPNPAFHGRSLPRRLVARPAG